MSPSSFPPASLIEQADGVVASAIENMLPSTRSVFDGVLREIEKAQTQEDAIDALETAYHLVADIGRASIVRPKLRVIPGGS
jgi:hypothetical protein